MIRAGSSVSVPISGTAIDGSPIGATTPSTGAFTTLSSTGVTTLKGTITNDSAAAGDRGQITTATVALGSTVALTTATTANITSISLTAGDWDVNSQVDFVLTSTTATLFQSAISLTSATLSTQPGGSGLGTDPLVGVPLITTTLSATYSQNISPVRVSLSATTTVYLVARGTFSAGTLSGYGTIRARRVR